MNKCCSLADDVAVNFKTVSVERGCFGRGLKCMLAGVAVKGYFCSDGIECTLTFNACDLKLRIEYNVEIGSLLKLFKPDIL